MVRESAITSMFAGSPVRPLQQHMAKACGCARLLPDFFRASAAGDVDACAEIKRSISLQESEADELKAQLRMNLPSSLFMPMPREQVLDIIRLQDKIANVSEDIAGIMVGRRMQIPEPLAAAVIEFVECAVEAVNQADSAINELDELVEAGFRGRQLEVVEEMIDKLGSIESQSDRLERELRHAMFEIEQNYPPLDMMFLYRTVDRIGKLADVASQVGARIQLLMAR